MMRQQRPSVGEADALTSLILEVFRLNGCLISAGDDLVSDLGLTSARWQVLGAMALTPAAETVARLARSMGLQVKVRRLDGTIHAPMAERASIGNPLVPQLNRLKAAFER